MYSALVKLFRAFLHSVLIFVLVMIAIAIAVAALQPIVEIAAAFGIHWAHRVMAFFVGGGL